MKRVLVALGIASGICCLLGIGFVLLSGLPLLSEAALARESADKFAESMENNWPEAAFEQAAAPRLLKLNPNWRADLAVVRQKIGPIQKREPAKSGQVIRDETVEGGTLYEALIEVDGLRSPAVIRVVLARVGGKFMLAQFFVEDRRSDILKK